MSDGTWIYAVTSLRRGLGELSGVAGEPVRLLDCAGLSAVVGTVDLAEFGEEPLNHALADPDRVRQLAVAHHEVVRTVAGLGAVVPFRLATVCHGDGRTRTYVDGRRDELAAVLTRIDGHDEWGVRAFLPDPPLSESEAAPEGKESAGAAYLLRRRAQLALREDRWARLVRRGEEIHAALSAVAADSTRFPLRGAGPADQDQPVLHGSYLIERGDEERFAAAVRAMSTLGARLEVTGPWAPYSFAGIGES